MKNPVVFMFSGQGSQYYHMGKDLFENNGVFRESMLMLDGIAERTSGISILEVLYDPSKSKGERFDRLLHTHPAIFMVGYSLAQALMAEGIVPEYVLGASMGEFASAVLAGILGVEDAFRLLIMQAEILEKHCAGPGGMVAILEDAALFGKLSSLHSGIELACVNFDGHFVVSGSSQAISNVSGYLQHNNILFQDLPVRQGFHSRHIDEAERPFLSGMARFEQRRPQGRFLSCVHGRETDSIEKDYFWNVIRKPIRFRELFRDLGSSQTLTWIDAGPSGTLANFAKRNGGGFPESEIISIMSPFGREQEKIRKIGRNPVMK